jgi:hypothetical protein
VAVALSPTWKKIKKSSTAAEAGPGLSSRQNESNESLPLAAVENLYDRLMWHVLCDCDGNARVVLFIIESQIFKAIESQIIKSNGDELQ